MTSVASPNPNAFDVSHRMVLAIALPMTLGLITVPIVGMVDMAVIGQLGDAALMGGIAIGALLFDFIAVSFNFLRMGTTGLTAQAVGANDPISQRAVIYRALMLALILGIAVWVLAPFVISFGLNLVGGSDQVNASAQAYLEVRLIAMPFALANFALFGWLFGLGKSRLGMVLLVLLNSANIGLTIWLVLGLNLGVEGAAWGTVAAELIACLAGLGLMAHHLRDNWQVPKARLFNRDAFMRFMALNRDIFIRSLIMLVAFGVFTSLSARQGDVVLAGNELLMHFFMFGGFFLDGIAVAAEQLAGRAIGAKYRPAFDRMVRLTLVWGFGLAAGVSLLMWAGGNWIIDLLTTAPDVRLLARDYLIYAALTPLVATLAFQMDGIFIGATWSVAMRNVSIFATSMFALSCWLLIPSLGNTGLWLAMLIFLASRGVGLSVLLGRHRERAFDVA